jgi:hypothetical protein
MKKYFMALLLIWILAIAGFAFESKTSAKNLVFLNIPEKVVNSGILGKQTIKNTSNTRIFFHYLNATGRDQVFNLRFEGNFFNFRSAISSDSEPGIAGAEANIAFFKAKEKVIKNPILTIKLPNNHTVSGIAEAKFIPGEKWSCELGTSKNVIDSKIITTDKFDKTIEIALNNKPIWYRLGDNRKSLIPGNYGYHFNFNVVNKSPKKKLLVCYLNPRGGKITGVFNVNKQIVSTAELMPKTETKFYHKILDSNQNVSVEYIPTGGYCYPIQIKFKLLDI